MSLILDALKKSERERQERMADETDAPRPRGAVAHPEGGTRGRRWPVVMGLVSAIVIVGGAAGYRYLTQPKPVVLAHVDTTPPTQESAVAPTVEPAVEPLAETIAAEETPAGTPELATVSLEPTISSADTAEPLIDNETLATEPDAPPEPASTALPEAEPKQAVAVDDVSEPTLTPEPEPEPGQETNLAVPEIVQPVPPVDATDEPRLAVAPRKPEAPPRPVTAASSAAIATPAAGAADSYQRAIALEQEGLLDQALAHYTEALVERPDFAEALYGRGWVQIARQDYGAAIRNFSDLIRLNPGMSPAYFGRGWAHELAGDNEQAVENYGTAIDLSPKEPSLRFNRAILNIYGGDFLAAERDLNTIRNKGNADERTFAQIWLFVARARSGVPTEDILPALRTTRTLGDWPGVVLDYLLGKASLDDVLAQTTADHYLETAARECIAYYFAGELSRHQGDAANAANYYRLAVATDAKDYRQYWAAKLELDRMGIAE